ncbi:F-box protein dampened isoform X1 [Haemaphysalis longicornis]
MPSIETASASAAPSHKMEDSGVDTLGSSHRGGPLNLLDLPSEILEKILRHASFATVSSVRMVCRHLNGAASSLLNSEFVRLRQAMQQRFQCIKAQMPRRESARRKHPLSRECDIVETVHMRLTLLQMTFGKHIERQHCCFFPGEVLDEVHRILWYVRTTPTLSRAYKVTDELFDLTTMAMEYFKEHIEPTLPEISYFSATADFLDYGSASSSYSSSLKSQISLMETPPSTSAQGSSSSAPQSPQPPPVNPTVKKRLRKLRESMKKNSGQVLALRRELKLTRRRVASQQRHLVELKARYDDYDQKMQTTSRKLNAVLQELSRCKTELQYWRSKSPAVPACACGKAGATTPLGEGPSSASGLDFTPIDFQEASSSASSLGHLGEGQPKLVPACYSTPPESISTLSLSDSECLVPDEEEYMEEVNSIKTGPKSSGPRGCKRKLDLDVAASTSRLVIKAHKVQRLPSPGATAE